MGVAPGRDGGILVSYGSFSSVFGCGGRGSGVGGRGGGWGWCVRMRVFLFLCVVGFLLFGL